MKNFCSSRLSRSRFALSRAYESCLALRKIVIFWRERMRLLFAGQSTLISNRILFHNLCETEYPASNLVPRVFVPYCACWLDETSCFPTAGQGKRRRWVRGWPCQRDAGTRLATELRTRPFSACNKGNRIRLHVGNIVPLGGNNRFFQNWCNSDYENWERHSVIWPDNDKTWVLP